MQGWLARRCQEVILTAMLCGAYIALEIGYRTFQYATLPYRISALLTARQPKGYIFDANTGYRYAPNLEVSWGPPSWHSYWRTNSYGHVSPFEYPTSKPPGEYRIAVVGDSYTANILNNVRWTEVLEDLLNQSIEWREHVGGNTTRVINFGVDGFGMVQLAGMVRSHVVAFEPDLTIVNFTVDAILQRIHYRAIEPALCFQGTSFVQGNLNEYDVIRALDVEVSRVINHRIGIMLGNDLEAIVRRCL